MPDGGISFQATLGADGNVGFLSLEARQKQIVKGHNPYEFGGAMAGNSPVFHGRQREFREIVQAFTHPGRPLCVSLLGERRIGKSSLINQVRQQLSSVPGTIIVYANALGWTDKGPDDFYTALGQSVVTVLPGESHWIAVNDFSSFRGAMRNLTEGLRIVLIIDEFELLADPPTFDETFFFKEQESAMIATLWVGNGSWLHCWGCGGNRGENPPSSLWGNGASARPACSIKLTACPWNRMDCSRSRLLSRG